MVIPKYGLLTIAGGVARSIILICVAS